eukprot:6212518-Pleurochrysis_carterae.AAC.6
MNLSKQTKTLVHEALVESCCKLVDEGFVLVGVGDGENGGQRVQRGSTLACFGSCREDLVKVNFGSFTVAAEYPARFASLQGAVVVELVGEDSLGLANERDLWTLDQVKGSVRYFALELLDASCALLFSGRAADRRFSFSFLSAGRTSEALAALV